MASGSPSLSVALLAIVVTIPIVLAAMGGWPLTTVGYRQAVQTVSAHGSVDPHLVGAWLWRGALIVAWISWMWMTVCVVLELRSWMTGRAPVRLPASRAVQSVAAFLVGTTLALSAVGTREPPVRASSNTRTSAIVPPAVGLKVIDDWSLVGSTQRWDESTGRYVFTSETGPKNRSTDQSADAISEDVSGRSAHRSTGPIVSSDGHDGPAQPAYRHGSTIADTSPSQHQVEARETLWSIAADHLGSSLRWRELAELNYGIRQADGGALTTAHWVTAGWLLQLPRNTDSVRPDGRQLARQPDSHTQSTDREAFTTHPTVGSGNRSGQGGPEPSPTPAMEDRSLDVVYDNGGPSAGAPLVPVGGSVVGAGVVSILDRMRRAQQRRRSSGRLIRLPDQSAATIERRLRIGDGSEAISTIDLSLRLLNRQWHDVVGDVPVVRGVRILDEVVELVVEGLDGSVRLPDHMVAGDDGTSLLVDRSSLSRRAQSTRRLRSARSPAPLLVTAGRGADDTVMVNLESLGSLVIQGDDGGCDAVLRALALELATSHWSGQFDLIAVGFGTELERFPRVRSTTDAPSVVRSLCHRRIGAHQALEASGYASFGEGRCLTDSDRWDPIVVICSSSVDRADVDELLEAGSDPAAGMAVVAVGRRHTAAYGVTLSSAHPSPSLELLGSVVFPHMIQAEETAQVTALLDTAGSRESVLSSDEPYVHLSVPVPGRTTDTDSTPARPGFADAPRPKVLLEKPPTVETGASWWR